MSLRRFAPLVKFVVSTVLIIVLFERIPFSGVVQALRQVNPLLLAISVVLFLAVNGLASFKWRLLLEAQGLAVTYLQALRVYFIGIFFNNFLPTNFGGDAMRAYRIARQTRRNAESALSVGFDRVHSLWALLLIAGPNCILSAKALGLPIELGFGIVACAFASMVVVILLLSVKVQSIVEEVSFHLPARLGRGVFALLQPFRNLRSNTNLLLWSTVVALASQALGFVVSYFIFASLRVSIDFSVLVSVISLATLGNALPLSINGIGVREGIYVVLLSQVGVAAPVAITLSILTLAIHTFSSLVGGILYAQGERGGKTPSHLLPST